MRRQKLALFVLPAALALGALLGAPGGERGERFAAALEEARESRRDGALLAARRRLLEAEAMLLEELARRAGAVLPPPPEGFEVESDGGMEPRAVSAPETGIEILRTYRGLESREGARIEVAVLVESPLAALVAATLRRPELLTDPRGPRYLRIGGRGVLAREEEGPKSRLAALLPAGTVVDVEATGVALDELLAIFPPAVFDGLEAALAR